MKNAVLIISILFSALFVTAQNKHISENQKKTFSIVIHGGAGYMNPETMTDEEQKAYHQKLKEAVTLGEELLEEGKTAIFTVEKVINILEDSPLFNAGKGAVMTNKGTCELDASLMDGSTLNAGAVAGVSHVKNPISGARLVLEKSDHVLLSGAGADDFAKKNGLESVANTYFQTEKRKQSLDRAKRYDKDGTVGCVVMDTYGNIAAGTSTGGMTNKKFGRIGDSPLIGAGTYADNEFGGISATGTGEYFIRLVIAYDIIALMKYKGMSMQEAADEVILKKLPKLGGRGGIIGLDADGDIVYSFTTTGMFRASLKSGGEIETAIFKHK